MDVTLLEATPNPEEVICRAARNDYMEPFNPEMSFEETMASVEGDTLREKKETLIGHLLQHGHFGPFEHPQATFGVKGCSRTCMAQITRHRHVSFDVRSMRYVSFDDVDPESVADGELVVTPPSVTDPDWVGRNNEDGPVDQETVERRESVFADAVQHSVEAYQDLLDLGMPPEDARFVLPLGTEVNIVLSMNVRMLMHVADMRAAADAQWEVRRMTEDILDLASEWAPISFDHYEDHMRNRKNRLAP
ncbi:FAD-dependent thymidylate synthase [Halanaeroarchaeum sulfurireducens]|uniref:Flavin-dependent thymidylate synthase n=1 Tax=Halanaeroarchaeum sulfurireducens TaxID=1604004 RepID=A0A0F7P9E9_9EURY|nr:FAD-dependent thymidylate synthase [Halanaeroarchaeum sulfurireducens]AKH97761.1 thymidylate synthase ThyX [Halanaeroarchaeum sulfurireducens]ALG82156.1 thymidylate synthase ThyX [Halanaeroarchaeum sulfurireducens]